MKMKHYIRRFAILPLVIVLLCGSFVFGYAGNDLIHGHWREAERSGTRLVKDILNTTGVNGSNNTEPYQLMRETLGVIQKDMYGPAVTQAKERKLVYAGISGMLATLNDPFTSFLDPQEWQSMQQTTRGDFEGIGAVLQQKGSDVVIVQPFTGSPAAKAGLKPGDIIIRVNGRSTIGVNIDQVVKWIKGPRNTVVTLTIMRKGQRLTKKLVRALVQPPVVTSWMTGDKIGYIRLDEFNEQSDPQFDAALHHLEQKGMRALIFDLRYNPGGLLNVAINVASHFIKSGPIVIIQERGGVHEDLMARPEYYVHRHFPLVVLVNGSSASASEIVSGAIKDDHVGTLIGEHTFGKALVQTLYPLNDGSALRLTTARYLTPNGHNINNKYDAEGRMIFGTGGVHPNIVVKQSPKWLDMDWSDKKDDTQLQAALKFLREKLQQRTASTSPAAK